jgi:hypothetical protein
MTLPLYRVLPIRPPKAPRLPAAPVEYDQRFIDATLSILRQYFNEIDNLAQPLTDTYGGSYLQFPFGSFYDTTSQYAASTTTAYPITLNNTSFSNTVTIVSGSRITFAIGGYYNVQFSAQLSNYDNAPQDIDIWFRQNGTDITNSNSKFGLAARKSAGDPYHTIGTVNLFVQAAASDYVELVWRSSIVSSAGAGAYIETYVAGTTPTRPATPSMIVTAQFVSANFP